MGARTYEDRQKDAEGFLEVFNAWVNGEGYWYELERVTECECCGHEVLEELDSCSGFIGSDHLFDHLRDVMGAYSGEDYEFAGECGWLEAYHSVR
jgi:hypothetical protein